MTYTRAFLFFVAIHGFFVLSLLWRAAVIFPHPNDLELGTLGHETGAITNRKFSDQSSVFIPEIHHHLQGNHRGWLSTWNPHVELGRPTFQLAGFGKAAPLTHLLSFFIGDPFVLYTHLTVIMLFLNGAFCFLLLRALQLHPLACCCSALGLSFGTFPAYWCTFVFFLSTLCWTLALLWLITEFVRKNTYGCATGISFATYNLLMTGYPQYVVMQAYLIIGFTLISLWIASGERRHKLFTLVGITGAGVFGALAALPAFLDLAIAASQSARLHVGDEFFLAVLPSIRSLDDLGLFFSQFFDPFWYGNVISPSYPFVFNGVTLTPVYSCLLLLSFTRGQWCTVWPWQLFVALCLFATLWPPAYLFMVHHLGFHLSRTIPIGGAIIPAFVLVGYEIDQVLRNRGEHSRWVVPLFSVPFLLNGLVTFHHPQPVSWMFIVLGFLLVLCTLWFVVTRRPAFLLFAICVSIVTYGFQIVLLRPLAEIQTSSPLVAHLRQETRDDTRYAVFGPNPTPLLPPNQEALLNLWSIHSYNSLSTVNFQQLTQQLSTTGAVTYGRSFTALDSVEKLDHAAFTYTGVQVLVSREALRTERFQELTNIEGIRLYKSRTPPLLEAQITTFKRSPDGQVVLSGTLEEQPRLGVERTDRFDEFLKFRVTPSAHDTLLFVSQQYHPHWQATAKNQTLTTVLINNFYLGVIIPPHIDQVEIEFRPFVRWSWIPQVFFLLLGPLLLIRGMWNLSPFS
uniref:Bacterial membrane protein YfhO n=1 Tax=uncultured bacterium F41-01 TaxID=1191437 RepID=I3VIR0_9BACT|nr:hypothetical protein [uncultured bacterium F41-01]